MRLNARGWYYLTSIVAVGCLCLWYAVSSSRISSQIDSAEAAGIENQTVSWQSYLSKQTDEHKLVRLLKRVSGADAKALELITLKAYELAPNNRDIVVLASYFRPELKEKVLQLDPLYN
jgi:hypothetical protein